MPHHATGSIDLEAGVTSYDLPVLLAPPAEESAEGEDEPPTPYVARSASRASRSPRTALGQAKPGTQPNRSTGSPKTRRVWLRLLRSAALDLRLYPVAGLGTQRGRHADHRLYHRLPRTQHRRRPGHAAAASPGSAQAFLRLESLDAPDQPDNAGPADELDSPIRPESVRHARRTLLPSSPRAHHHDRPGQPARHKGAGAAQIVTAATVGRSPTATVWA